MILSHIFFFIFNDFYNEDSDIDGHISHEDTASFYINARRGYAAAFDGALYYTDETKKAYDALCGWSNFGRMII